jgi:hypothetical protein
MSEKQIKKNITGATPSEIIEMLIVYGDGVEIPLDNFPLVMRELEKNKHHLFAIGIKNDKVHIRYSETI